MKVLICTDSFLPGVGGTEEACFGYANGLKEAGVEVMVACPRYRKNDEEKDKTYKFKVVRLPSIGVTSNDRAVMTKIADSQIKMMEDFKPDLIHIESVSGLAKIGLWLGKKLDVPIVMTVHTRFRETFKRGGRLFSYIMVKKIVKRLRMADQVITVVDNMKEEIASYGFDGPVTVIKNGAMFKNTEISDAEKIKIRRELNFEPKDKVMIYVGHIVSYKRVDFLLQSLRRAVDKGLTNERLILVGGGADLDKIKVLSKELKLEDRVVFTGRLTDKAKIMDMYHASDLFIMASICDNDPITVVEAASCKVPALVLEGTGSSNRIKDGVNGFTAKNDVEDFSDKMVKILNSDLTEISKVAMQTVPTPWSETVSKHLPIYKKLISAKNAEKVKNAEKAKRVKKAKKMQKVENYV